MPIKYVINLMLENRSFDQIFGYRYKKLLSKKYNYYNGKKYKPTEVPYFNGEGYGRFSHQASLYSINTPRGDKISQCGGFVYANKSYSYIPILNNPNPPEMVMGYFPPLPIFDFLANNYMLCENYFSSLPGQTDTNRFFSLSATSRGQVNDYLTTLALEEVIPQTQETILTRLVEKGHTCNIYSNTNMPVSLFLLRHVDFLSHYYSMDDFFEHIEKGNLPLFSYIEPAYEISNIPGRDTNDYDLRLVESVYNALQNNKEVWENCLLIINFDEHGGYHDHVYPHKTVAPDNNTQLYNFEQYGVRVPCLVISPLVGAGIDKTVYDHTSVLATVERLVGIEPLTRRDKEANDFLHLVNLKPKDTKPFSSKIYNFPYPEITAESMAQTIATFALIIYKMHKSPQNDNKDFMSHAAYRLVNFIMKDIVVQEIEKEPSVKFISDLGDKAKSLAEDLWERLDQGFKAPGAEDKIISKLATFYPKCIGHLESMYNELKKYL
jgi:phospholipase C